ncbi:hypothetical protein BFR57_09270 [Idiomarina sp. MD25a]|nr:hypothetical protein BFR57_09270 [Idiomarina sp. MD25a]
MQNFMVLLGVLIPGGPIENRDFSHIPPLKLGAFNVFLTILGIASFALVYFSIEGSTFSFIVAAICGVSYFLVYALDLGKIFPVSPTRMPRALFWIEIVGLILSIPLTLLSLVYVFISKGSGHATGVQSDTMIMALIAIMALGIGVVIFATKAAMRKSPSKANSDDAKKQTDD